jgi:CRP/FNR family transcriptional regulator
VRETECFCRLSSQALEDLQRRGVPVSFATGEVVVHEGFRGEKVYIVCHGRVKLTASSPEGRLLLLRVAEAGDVLGLAPVLNGGEHKVTAETLEPCEMMAVGRTELLAFMDRYRDAGRNAVLTIVDEYEEAMLSVRRLSLSESAAQKLASVLVEWGRREAKNGAGRLEFTMPLTHEELGAMAGLSRETVTRLLARFRREGTLQQHGKRMIIEQPERLETQP